MRGGGWGIAEVRSSDGKTQILYSEYIDKSPVNRRWHDVFLDLSRFSGQSVVLALSTDGGPSGDASGDRAGWGIAQIILGVAERLYQDM